LLLPIGVGEQRGEHLREGRSLVGAEGFGEAGGNVRLRSVLRDLFEVALGVGGVIGGGGIFVLLKKTHQV